MENDILQQRQIASSMSYLHDMKPVVVHGDLKGVCSPAIAPHA